MKKYNSYSLLASIVSLIIFTGCALFVGEPEEESVDVASRPQMRYGVEIDGYTLVESEVGSGETMGSIMSSFGRTARDIDRVDRASRSIFSLRKMRAGSRYIAFVAKDSQGVDRLDYIAYERDPINYVLFVMLGDSVSVQLGERPINVLRQRRVATINSSLWAAIMDGDMPQELSVELEDIYQWSINFFNIERGDKFVVIYDERFIDGSKSVGLEGIKGVKFTHKGEEHYAIAFKQGEREEYWDESGRGLRMQILKVPLQYTHVGSRPSIVHSSRVQDDIGVNFAVPTGTPVIAVADGVVSYQGSTAEDGNIVKIRHDDDLVTGYLHLSRFARGVERGSHVSQGDLIGYVGSTGAAQEPHLEYRMWHSDTPIDPLEFQSRSTTSISSVNRVAFDCVCKAIVAELDGER